MQGSIDLDAYLRRVGWHGRVAADLASLRGLAVAHVATIPFENLTPLLGLPVELDTPALERKLVHEGRGGYCFEQNLLFAAVLRTIGFEVSGLIARVLWQHPEDAVTAQTHMLLRVELGGESWLADVGFGNQVLTGALRLQADVEQPTGHEPFRLVEREGEWRMQSCVRGQWFTLYRFDLRRCEMVDYVVANHYVSTHAASRFPHNLIAARTTADRRLSLLNREFTVRRLGQEPERHRLDGVAEIRHVLEHEFLLRLPAHADLDRRLDGLPG
ncbi:MULTISPECIES: arylamine N-acetyltransferase family protein [Rhodanobacter]|uniref:arylamine N-acetyltransferase family protein n=1 Tax=Rhodanobacter TaxID=75309 RepID=UPI0004049E76|nr:MULTISPECIES: arylamine N-acetyltransferase [Rhodanobacter]UJJ52427.1 arylamine N-acetyltransferase [Rhodanobacter denitrificans]UJM95180.1 arylamine N-acetyltransferase [Rhodanobacter denitrificans]UJM98711.1 arylamine N-acetyltransferase [Rhodanobacter denitrificans]UJN21874.1 arylamine N-acetyltransferase [Rhodanobacter denitrificans]